MNRKSSKKLTEEERKLRYPGWSFVKRKPQFLVDKKKYAWMLQGNGINILSLLTQAIVDDCLENDESGITRNGVTILFDTKDFIVHDRAQQFLFYIILNFSVAIPKEKNTELSERAREVTMKFSDIAEAFGLTYHGAKKMAVMATRTIYNLSVEWTEKVTIREENKSVRRNREFAMRFLEDISSETIEFGHTEPGYALRERGSITVMLATKFANYLVNYAHKMQFPVALFRISPKYDANAFSFGLKLALHFRMNLMSKTDDPNRINVLLLIKSSGGIPPYDYVMQSYQLRRLVIKPFERALDHLVDYGILTKWYYEDPALGKIEGRMKAGMNHEKFFSLNIYFELADHPYKVKANPLPVSAVANKENEPDVPSLFGD